MTQTEISRTDILALERTKLANERTFLAYFRTFVVFVSSGFVILKVDALENLIFLGYTFIVMGIVLLVIGTARFLHVKQRMAKYFS
ncbi:MAG: DUF202 domain-containing protein [Roseivirga sp.]|nr:DUF202 domain-containing protein [Roseivirga sp.]